MKEILPQTGAMTQTRQYNARWYQATTLTERIPFLQHNTSLQPTATQAGKERAKQRLKQWKNQPAFTSLKQTLAQRLELDTLTETRLLALLAQPAEEIQASFSTPPTWLVELMSAFTEPDTSALERVPFEKLEDPHTRIICQAIEPLLARGFARVWNGIEQLQQNYSRLPFDPQTIGMLLLPNLLKQLLNRITKTLVLELNVARVQGRLQGETPEQRFDYFLTQLTRPEQMLTLLEEYPVLARYLVERIELWANCELEVLQRLCADWDEICSMFAPDGDPGVLSEIQEGAGDIHNHGHSVTLLTWSSGLRLVYKPRSLAIDLHFQELLTWLNQNGCQPALRTLKVLARDTYGWCEFVTARECVTKEEIERFYQRLGGYLALLYALEATDFHAENVLTAGEDPMLIDVESLFQPRVNTDDRLTKYGYEMFKHSVQRPGLLPQRIWSSEDDEGVDLSGLPGQTRQLTPFPISTLKGQGTDEMHVAKERMEVDFSNHRPVLKEEEVDTLVYEQNMIIGFTMVYRLLIQHRTELLDTILPRFAHDEIRVLFRQTQTYIMIQEDSFHPNALRDALDRDRILDRLWIGIEHSPHLTRLIKAERTDILRDDTPKFVTSPASRDLLTSDGEIIPEFFQKPSLDGSRECIQYLDEKDLERQIWIIRAAFASLTLKAAHTIPKSGLRLAPTQAPIARERLMRESLAIGNRLYQLALIREDLAGWLIMNIVGGKEWQPIAAAFDFYSGLSGIACFLAYLGAVSGENQYTTLARLTLKTLQELFMSKEKPWPWRGVGAFDGIGSLIYLLSHLGTLWQEPALYEEAEQLVAQLPALISADTSFDLTSGSASCIAALLSLYAVAPSEPTLAAALQCGDHLLSHTRSMPQGIAWSPTPEITPLAGMAHGNAGIALNLLRLAAISKEERFRQAAFEAIAYERSLFSPEKQNWPDLRDFSGVKRAQQTEGPVFMTAWCHGAVGIGMARVASLPYHDDAATREEIHAAIQNTLAEGFGRNHSVCHGDMGSLEFLFNTAQVLPDAFLKQKVESLQASLLASMEAQGWHSGVPMGVETPSFMLGLAGTGYALLRQAAPEQVPSMLLLEPPIPVE